MTTLQSIRSLALRGFTVTFWAVSGEVQCRIVRPHVEHGHVGEGGNVDQAFGDAMAKKTLYEQTGGK